MSRAGFDRSTEQTTATLLSAALLAGVLVAGLPARAQEQQDSRPEKSTASEIGKKTTQELTPAEVALLRRRLLNDVPRWRYIPKRNFDYSPKPSFRYTPKTSYAYTPKKSFDYTKKRTWGHLPLPEIDVDKKVLEKNAYQISCTHPLLAGLVEHIVGDRAEVESVNLRGYLTNRSYVPKGLRMEIDVFFAVGMGIEPVDELLEIADERPVYVVSEKIDTSLRVEKTNQPGQYDPHWWLDGSMWKECTQHVLETLSELDPPAAVYYQRNHATYAEKLDQLSDYAGRVLSTIPQQHRFLVTPVDAFTYLARDHGLETITVTDLASDVGQLIHYEIHTVFTVTTPDEREFMEQLIDVAWDSEYDVTLGGVLLTGGRGERSGYEGTYVGMMDYNITTIARALGGNAPIQGMQGELSRFR